MDAEDIELDHFILVAAASLLHPVEEVSRDGGRTHEMRAPSKSEIETAVRIAKKIWREVSLTNGSD